MTSPDRPRAGLRAWPIAAVAIAVAIVCAFAAWRPGATAPTARVASGEEVVAAVTAQPLALPEHPRVLIFGDSWTYGSAATDPAGAIVPTLGYAYLIGANLGWEVTVAGVRGSGYLKPGIDGPSFGERIAALDPDLDPDLVIVQGSINDRVLVADDELGEATYRAAVISAWDALARLYPDAAIVVLGPAPHVLPVGKGTAAIDGALTELAGARGWWYVSPVAESWITEANYLDVIDTGAGRNHPSTAGHAYLADRLAKAVASLAATTDAVAEVPADGTDTPP